MSTRKLALAFVVAAFTPALVGPGCGGSSSTGTGGKGGKDGGAAGTSTAGTNGTAGTSAAGTSAAGTSGIDAAAGTTNNNADAAVDMPGADLTPPPPDGGHAMSWLFDTTTLGWTFAKYGSTPNGAPDSPANLAHTSVMAFDGTNDSDSKTTSGSLKGTVPFTTTGERIDFQAFSVGAGMFDWYGYKVTGKVKLVSGGNLTNGCPLSAVLYVSGPSTQDYKTVVSPAVDLVKGSWVTVTFDIADAALGGADISHISQMGFRISTGAPCAGTPGDGGADGGTDSATDAVVAEVGSDAAHDGGTDASAASDAGTDLLVDAGLADVIDAVVSDASDASDAAPPLPITSSTAVILIDSVTATLK